MVDQQNHNACVSCWMERTATGLPPDRLLQLFERTLGALWRRAHVTLGDVTLTAIVRRVLYTASEQFAVLASVEVDDKGPHHEKLHDRARDLDADHLREAIHFVLLELLTVLGNLTAEILTPALHAELSCVEADPTNPESQGAEEPES
jgi:hypothetical protein